MESGLYWRFKNDDITFDIKKYIKSNDLDSILNYEGLIQEIKSENIELLNFLVKEENLKKILSYIIEESNEKDNYDKSYKFPYKSHQIISSENKLIIESIVYNDKLMKYFWKFILNKDQLNEVLAGYFSRCAIVIYNKNTQDVVNFLKKKKELYLKAFLYHFYSRNITELFKVLLFVKDPYLCIFDNKDIIYLILSNLDGNFCEHVYIPCDREDNITCLIRDIFVRKTEIYYFNYFLVDLASQLSFSYLIKCVFSECPYTISAAITIISDLLHYTVLAKTYNNINFYECLEIYNKEEELKKNNIKEMEKYKKKKKRKPNKMIENQTSRNITECITKEESENNEHVKKNIPNDIINNITNLERFEKEKREIEKSEIEKEDINKEKQINNLNKKKMEENNNMDIINEEKEEIQKKEEEEEEEKEKEKEKEKEEEKELEFKKKNYELNNLFTNNNNNINNNIETNYFSFINKENNLNDENNKESYKELVKKENQEDSNYNGNKNIEDTKMKKNNNFNGDNVLSNYDNDCNSINNIYNYINNNNNNSDNHSNNVNNASSNSIDNIIHLDNNKLSNEKKNPDNKNGVTNESSNFYNIQNNQKNNTTENNEQIKNENIYDISYSYNINDSNYKENENENTNNDTSNSYSSEASSSEEEDDSLNHLKKIKFEEVLNKMKKIASNKINKKDGIIKEEKNKDTFSLSNDPNILDENNKQDTFHIFQKEEGDANIPLSKWIEYLENSTFIDICFFSYIKDIMKLYIKNINKNKNKNILGFTTLEIIQLIKTLIKTKSKNILTEIIDEGFFDISIDIFFKYKWNNLLHISVCDLLQTIIFKENEYSYLLYYILALTTFLPKCLRYFDAVRRCRNIKNKKKKKKFESFIDCGYKAHLLHICQILSNKSLEIKWLSNFLVTVSGWNDIIIDELNHYSLYFNDVNYSDEKKTEVDHNEISNICNDNKKDLENKDNNFSGYSNVIDILFDENKNDYTKYDNIYHKNNSDYSLSSNCNFNNIDSENLNNHNAEDNYSNRCDNINEHNDYNINNYKNDYDINNYKNDYDDKFDNYSELNDDHNSKNIHFSDNSNNYIYDIKSKIDNSSDTIKNSDNNSFSN
ncbi:conserved Plasmodium protein, unknown function [Plasmodium relictum]|uniref:Protein SOC1 n=1 Tax=Plasmodium relictum TaxID=85471 RepID=A0A1J1H226_PLARL|nr:conserved Plasmodium protein, unknown function [Plasmodium relictum]CRG98976.1 conserved Plasmodium protein, unknown function [Plasmodium relictum]